MKQTMQSLLSMLALVLGIWFFSPLLADMMHHYAEASNDPHLLLVFVAIAPLFLLSFIGFYLSHKTPLPSFVIALFLGIASHSLLAPIVENQIALQAIVSVGAILILFQGGLETSFKGFQKLFPKIAMLAFPGVILSAILLSYTTFAAGNILGVGVSVTAAILLGVLLASTDPAAIIPLFQGLRFKKSATKDIVVSESALNDVVGALLTLVLVGIALTSGPFESIGSGFMALFTQESGIILLKQMLFGVLAGLGGYFLLVFLSAHKKDHGFENGADASFFIFVPIIAFATALEFGGSGYLAAFIAGLIFHLSDHLKKTEHFYNDIIDGFAKPTIFLLLGALVDPITLVEYAGIGILVGLLFMFVIRPLVVFAMLGIFAFFGKDKLSLQQLIFISWVRETGAIPAVLLVTIVGLGLPGVEALVPIGMWVILLTLVVQPPLTSYLAQRLKLAEEV